MGSGDGWAAMFLLQSEAGRNLDGLPALDVRCDRCGRTCIKLRMCVCECVIYLSVHDPVFEDMLRPGNGLRPKPFKYFRRKLKQNFYKQQTHVTP